jgi:AI-2 transport protein TqsA
MTGLAWENGGREQAARTRKTVIGSYLEPRIAGAALSVSPFLILLAVFFWGFLWGIPGAFIGVPIVIAVLTVCEQHEATKWVATLVSGRDEATTHLPM